MPDEILKKLIDGCYEILTVAVEANWLPPYRLEYDGKYVTLFGHDKEYPCWYRPDATAPIEYEEMCLIGALVEKRNIFPEILSFDDGMIKIVLHNKPLNHE